MFLQDFKLAVIICLRDKFFKFSGRAPRAEYWYFFLFCLILNILLSLLEGLLPFAFSISNITALVLFFPTIAVSVRRLHDLDKSGWFMLAPFGSIVLGSIMLLVGSAMASAIVSYLGIALCIFSLFIELIIFVFFIRKGTDGDNAYGEDPLLTQPWADEKNNYMV